MTSMIATDSPFTVEEQAQLTQLAGMIVAASEEFDIPGADDDLIALDIISSAAANEDEIRQCLQLASDTAENAGQSLENITDLLEGKPQMAAFVSLVMQCYYRDDRVMESLGMEARAPFPKGYEVEQGDWSMLEDVQKRGKIWRDA